jgi:hypothetical protein
MKPLPDQLTLPGALDGVDDANGKPSPSTPEEAREAGVEAARRGDKLHEVIFAGVSRYPGSAPQISRLIAAAVTGWFDSQQTRVVSGPGLYTPAILVRRGSGHDQWLRIDTGALKFVFEDDETGRVVETLTVAEMKMRFPLMAGEVGNAIAGLIRER